jgi:glycosyltransferase involved in cell wall biosynthesis
MLNNPIDLERFSQLDTFQPRKTKIAFVGRLVTKKDPITPLYALKRALKTNMNIELHFIGDGPLRKKLEKLAQKLNISRSVVFHGAVRDPSEIVRKCSIFVSSSISYNFPSLSILEAMALKKPIIASNLPETELLVKNGKNGFLFEKKNVKELSRIFSLFNERESLVIAMGSYSEQMVANFDIKRVGKQLIDLYSGMMSPSSFQTT